MITQEDAQDKKWQEESRMMEARHSTGCPKIKKGMRKKKLQEEALYIAKRVGAEEPKTHDGGQTDRHSTGRPKIKWACAKRLQEEALCIARGATRRKSHNGGPD